MRNSFVLLAALVIALNASAQDSSGAHSDMHSAGAHCNMHMGDMESVPVTLAQLASEHAISGTDVEPNSMSHEMLMTRKAQWEFMFHGELFLNETQQSGRRGGDKFFSTNWFMPMARRKVGRGTLTLRGMFSLEPATVSDRRYPELFQQGETAFGRPIADGQHPHDFFMELAAIYDYAVKENTVLTFYAAPVGDPALGPPAYPHRASASEDPLAPLGHHFQDSTHIADDVITVGLTHSFFRVEASGFHGREPDEYRWNIDSGKIDSWSTRVTVNPGQNWSFQYSIADLASPEGLAPDEDTRRMTASVIYNLPIQHGNWTSMVLWGRNQSLRDRNIGNSYLFESNLRFAAKNNVWTRIENVDRTNELLLGEVPLPANFTERYVARVQAYTAGYDREIGDLQHISTALGAQLTWYGVPAVFMPAYGSHPWGAVVFLRLRAK